MNRVIESTNVEVLRIMECVRKVRDDTKGAVYVALGAVWWDLEKVVLKDFIEISSILDKREKKE